MHGARLDPVLPAEAHRRLFYDGAWHDAAGGGRLACTSPGTGRRLAEIALADARDLPPILAAAQRGFAAWRDTPPLERARVLREIARIVRAHAGELAALDAADGGNPVRAMAHDVEIAASQLEFFAGLVTEMKGHTVPMGPQALNLTLREPVGIVAKILPFNHPFMFCAGKAAAPLAAGNAVIVKPPEQAPLSALRFAELVETLLPAGVLSIVPGGREFGQALAAHPTVGMVSLIGSVATGRAVLHAAAETIKPALLELGGKNALIAFPDADPREVAQAVVAGMNFPWCGQSCGSTSRAFLHESLHDRVLEHVAEALRAFRPGDPLDPATTMGAIIDRRQLERVLDFIASARAEGARLVAGGGQPAEPALAAGCFCEPTVFADVTPAMRIAREEVFGPVLSVLRWTDEASMLDAVNGVPYGLTCSIWTDDLERAHRTAQRVQAGFVWVNEVSRHFLGAPFGGVKQSGLGREECLDELLAYTQMKNVHVRLRAKVAA
jgi:betaine-aldehyde dehydrogenase